MLRTIQSYICVLATIAVGCSDSFKPDVSTETGNPPVIDSRKIALVVSQDEVRVRGEAGAIMPPEADVEVTIVRTQDVMVGDVEDDGSFDVMVEATLDDVFEVRAVLGDERSIVVTVDRGGAMVGEGEGDGGMLSCGACIEAEIAWRVTSPGTLPALPSSERHEISACNQLTRRTVASSCSSAVPRCESQAAASIEAINALIASDEVQAAIGRNDALGEPEETAGFWYNITIDGSAFTFRSCAGASSIGCAPRGPIEELIDLLEQVQQENTCTLEPLDRCDAPFDAGSCNAIVPVLWHDPATGECVERTYGGCGGNANRHTSLGACLAACPAAGQETPCPAGRQPITYCYECGPPLGNCALEGPFCTQECERDDDCVSDNWPQYAVGICNTSSGLCMPPGICL